MFHKPFLWSQNKCRDNTSFSLLLLHIERPGQYILHSSHDTPWVNCIKKIVKCRQMYGLCLRRLSPRTPYTCDRIRNNSTTHSLEPHHGTLTESWSAITRPAYPMHTVLNHHPHSRLRVPMEGPSPAADLHWTQAPLQCCTALGIWYSSLGPLDFRIHIPRGAELGPCSPDEASGGIGSDLLGEEKACDTTKAVLLHVSNSAQTARPSLSAHYLRYL